MSLSPEPGVDVHGHGEQLPERRDRLEQQDDDAAAFDRLHRPRQQVGGQGFEVLQHAHAVSVAKNLVRLLIVAVPEIVRDNL